MAVRSVTMFCILLDAALGWSPTASAAMQVQSRRALCTSRLPPRMMAKSKKPNRKKQTASKPYIPAVASPSPAAYTESASGLPVVETSSSPGPRSDAPVEDRVAQVLRDAGMATDMDSGVSSDGPKQPADPLSRIPKKGQELLERFFAGGALTFGSIFLISGIAVSVEALCKVLGSPLPVAIDEALVQYVEPALTPSILILFFFSISLGLLKQLQLGSESAGVLYTEDDD